MKKTLFVLALMSSTLHVYGQQYTGRMGEDPEVGGPRREQEFFSRLYAPGITPQGLNRLWEEIHAMPSEDAQQTNPSAGWKCIGPFGFDVNTINPNYGPTRWTGRVLDLELQPSGALRFAAASGGLWEAFFGAAPLSDGITSLRIGSFATRSGDRNTIIVGTGENFGTSPLGYGTQGTGLWKTTDGGGTWRHLQTPGPAISYVQKVRFHDVVNEYVYAATDVGLFRSTDFGETWSHTLPGNVWDFAFAIRNVPGGGGEYRIFAVRDNDGLHMSTDFGSNWTHVTQLPTSGTGRGSISAARPSGWFSSTIYVSLSPYGMWNDTLVGIYKSTDAGDTWSNVSPPLNLFGTRLSPYSNTIGACPTNPDIVLVGWMKMYRTTTGGQSWELIDEPPYPAANHDRTHDDWHEVLWTYGSRVYGANDGGIFYSDDYGYTWGPAFAYQVAPITQFYYFDVSPDNHDIIYGGAQDNGITGTISGGAGWLGTNCCDGAGVAIDYGGWNVFAIAGSLPYSGPRYRSTNYGFNWNLIPPSGGLMPGKVIRLNRGSVSWLYTDNGNQVMTSADNGVTWYVLGGSGGTLPASINNLTVGNWLGGYGSEVYAALTNGQLWVNSQGTWFNRSVGLPAATVHKVAIHPVYTGVGYALMEGISPILQGNKIFRTIDRGQTWVNITGNLPNLPITDLVAHPNNPNLLYLGTAMGCYKSTDGGATWIRWNFGMPEANIVTEMSYIDSTTFNGKFYVVAATYGRSIWKRDASTDDPYTSRFKGWHRNITIADGSHALDTIHVPSLPPGVIRKVTLGLDSLLHSYDGDLIITLLHQGVRDTLVNRTGGEGHNFIGTTLDDDASISISQGYAPFTGIFLPYQPLSSFDGLSPEGDWTLDVYDMQPGNTGELRAWSLTVSYGMASGVTIQTPVAQGWNLASLPVSNPTPDDSVSHVFTGSVFPYGYRFNGGYILSPTLQNGPGYWIKSSATYAQAITGTLRDSLTIPVVSGWNLIGSISTSIDTSATHVSPSPPGLRSSLFFKYDNGYVVAETIDPGGGYWVRTNGAGSFFIHATGPVAKNASESGQSARTLSDLNTLIIKDAAGGSQTLYFGADLDGEFPVAMFALPPVPPEGLFDARFLSADGGAMVKTHAAEIAESTEMPISVLTSAFPLTVTWKITDAGAVYELRAGEDMVRELRAEGTLRITREDANRLTLRALHGGSDALPKECALLQNYPNPFNPSTKIAFSIPVRTGHPDKSGQVAPSVLKVYDVLGREVRTLVNENLQAGSYEVTFDAAGLASGIYFYRLQAGEFVQTKKLLLLR